MVWRHRALRKPTKKFLLPEHARVYAIGDVHGRADLLERLFSQIEFDQALYPAHQSTIVFLGDYIDRGPDTRHVIDTLLRFKETHESVFLKGNHETFVRRFLKDPATLDEWRFCGGLETLISYGLMPSVCPDEIEQKCLATELAQCLPQQHLEFLDSLQSYFESGDFLFVHAGIRPKVPLAKQTEHDLLWIREEFLRHDRPFERYVVHGHTPVPLPDIRHNRANIDTGAFATGRLTCIAIEGAQIVPLIDVRNWVLGANTRIQEASVITG